MAEKKILLLDKESIKKLHIKEIEILDYIVNICSENKLAYFLIGGTLLGSVRHKGFIPWDDDLDLAMPRRDFNIFIDICAKKTDNKFILHYGKTDKKYFLTHAKVRNKYTIYEQDTEQHYNYNINKGVFVDIFPLDNAKKEKNLLQTFQAMSAKIVQITRRIKNDFPFTRNIKIKKIVSKLLFFVDSFALLQLQEKIMQINKDDASEYFVSLASHYSYKKQTIEKTRYFPARELEFEGKMYKVPNDYDYILKRIYGDYMKLPPENKRIMHDPVKIILDEDEFKRNEKI